jgi:predicted DNA binding CopG/RHH family protein
MTTAKSMKFFLQKNDAKMSIVLPKDLKNAIKKRAKRNGINPSQFVKLAIMEKLNRDEFTSE